MRTSLDHFISEGRQQKDRCTTTANTVQRSPDISVEADIGISEEQTHQGSFSWCFEDANIDNTEVFGGGYSDNSTSSSAEADFGSEVETTGAAPSHNEQSGQRSKLYSYSEINRPVRILLGRTKTQQ